MIAHRPGAALGTTAATDEALRELLAGFELVRTSPVALAGAEAALYELRRA